MKKTYALDTNILVSDPFSIFYIAYKGIPEEIYEEFKLYLPYNIKKPDPKDTNDIIISRVTINELNKIKDDKKHSPNVVTNSQLALKILSYLLMNEKNYKKNKDGINIGYGSKIYIAPRNKEKNNTNIDKYSRYENNDSKILHDLEKFKKSKGLEEIILITQDAGMIISAKEDTNMKVEEYHRMKIKDYEQVYTGRIEIKLKKNLEYLLSKRTIETDQLIELGLINKKEVHPNEFIKLISEYEPNHFEYKKISQDTRTIKALKYYKEFYKDVYSDKNIEKERMNLLRMRYELHNLDKNKTKKNKKQKDKNKKTNDNKAYKTQITDDLQRLFEVPFNDAILPQGSQISYLELLLDPKIKIVSVIAEQGAGKSHFALTAGLYQIKKGFENPNRITYDKIVIIRSFKEIGESMGYLPGDIDDKLDPWKKSIYDNLQSIYGANRTDLNIELRQEIKERIKIIESLGLIEFIPHQYLQGRTLENSYMIIDECQNMSLEELSLYINRAGHGTKVILLGDPKQARLVNKYFKLKTNSVVEIANRFCDEPLVGHITFNEKETYRSEIARLGLMLLDKR